MFSANYCETTTIYLRFLSAASITLSKSCLLMLQLRTYTLTSPFTHGQPRKVDVKNHYILRFLGTLILPGAIKLCSGDAAITTRHGKRRVFAHHGKKPIGCDYSHPRSFSRANRRFWKQPPVLECQGKDEYMFANADVVPPVRQRRAAEQTLGDILGPRAVVVSCHCCLMPSWNHVVTVLKHWHARFPTPRTRT